MPNYGMSTFDREHSPLLVGQVCMGWRQVALSTEALWSSITVTRDRFPNKMANLWISRALNAPLTIHLGYAGFPTIGPIKAAISVLVQYCDRWKALELRIPQSMMPRLQSIRNRLPSLESLSIQNVKDSRSWSHEFSIFEFAPRLRRLSLGCGIFHARLTMASTDGVDCPHKKHYRMPRDSPTRTKPVRCTVYNASSILAASIPLQNTPIITFPQLCSFRILHSVHPNEIFKHLQLPIIHALHVAYNDESNELKWFSQQPFVSLLTCSSHTLRKLEIDCLHVRDDSTHIVHCLRAASSLEELCLRGSGGWVTADLLHFLTRRENIDALVPALEAIEIRDHSIPCYDCMSMIESRRVTVGAYLKRVHIEMVMTEDWLVDTEILNRLHKCRQEGMFISIVNIAKLLDSPSQLAD
jgi:hypothetical protein